MQTDNNILVILVEAYVELNKLNTTPGEKSYRLFQSIIRLEALIQHVIYSSYPKLSKRSKE